jgi:hypothetical protein
MPTRFKVCSKNAIAPKITQCSNSAANSIVLEQSMLALTVYVYVLLQKGTLSQNTVLFGLTAALKKQIHDSSTAHLALCTATITQNVIISMLYSCYHN